MSNEENFLNAVKQLRKPEKERNFDQTVDLVINLKNFDVRRESFNLFIKLPNKIKNKRICAFFEKDSKLIDVVKKSDFPKYKDKKEIKKLIKSYDFFIANAKLMPEIATNFGRVLGPVGKMPSPQLGILPNEEDKMIEDLTNKINSTLRIRIKEPSIKIGIGKESLDDEKIVKNALVIYNKIVETLPRKKDNIKNIQIKFTMTKPIQIKF